ncbi:MAG: hypothetical protein HGA85_08210 [Nanoarchaeota archaeon]|nr:hypothetical protein [Nanoarchaeota archaeon]
MDLEAHIKAVNLAYEAVNSAYFGSETGKRMAGYATSGFIGMDKHDWMFYNLNRRLDTIASQVRADYEDIMEILTDSSTKKEDHATAHALTMEYINHCAVVVTEMRQQSVINYPAVLTLVSRGTGQHNIELLADMTERYVKLATNLNMPAVADQENGRVEIKLESPAAYRTFVSEHGIHKMINLGSNGLKSTSYVDVTVKPFFDITPPVFDETGVIEEQLKSMGSSGGGGGDTSANAVRLTYTWHGRDSKVHTVSALSAQRSHAYNREVALKVLKTRFAEAIMYEELPLYDEPEVKNVRTVDYTQKIVNETRYGTELAIGRDFDAYLSGREDFHTLVQKMFYGAGFVMLAEGKVKVAQ